ncbi:hypothetical protein LTR37_013322 [Vermiconidia calcicola]|uniref:Uncharacterized protein n=1 Tax=Vermiconidia calcicola TaxID=1690605 RepID=A0ACC3MX69_9PEZI|nr:hypothetical protein LTR37_013322 [Vermiconidia calcicola]
MAVSLSQHSQNVSRQRASTVPSNMGHYHHSPPVSMPTPEQYQYQHNFSTAPLQLHGYNHGPAPTNYQSPSLYYQSRHSYQPASYQQSSIYYQSPAELECSEYYQPSIPPKQHTQPDVAHPPSPQYSDSEYSTSSGSTNGFSMTSIEPDPLPPHSNPQALTQTQSHAFAESQPIPAVRIGKDEVWNSVTGIADFSIAREAARMPSFLSTKPLLTVIKTETALSIGNVRFHTRTSNNIDLTVNGQETSISHSGFMHNRWGFQPTTCRATAEKWYWRKDRKTGGAMLEDAKRHGHVLARMKGDLLTFEKARLSQESRDEIVMSAIAMAEAARRQKRKGDIVDLASAIGDFTASAGGDGGGGGGGGGDGGGGG